MKSIELKLNQLGFKEIVNKTKSRMFTNNKGLQIKIKNKTVTILDKYGYVKEKVEISNPILITIIETWLSNPSMEKKEK